ncbi:flagellar hook-basal body complex protein [Clostridium sp. Marseille-P2415]|uniref:flagellar hook-basal body complex protein n=1 Tax=Clostridium sp. Marseille-P2415 TaxID=1805471 RepID=UPI0013565E26|nr:flagellar hook-basal body complex protein [Clostridium sp. Marseille-P2415]
MVKSMFAGVAGLRTHQSKMDVIGNNIANVNTWGYKAGSMSFKDTMYQNTSSGSGGSTETGGFGGTNANQIGYGVTTGSISYDFSSGGMSPSARGLDCMIEGTGFFLVGPMIDGGSVDLDSDDAIKASGLYLSRVGKFDVDGNGYLVDDSGNYVYGFVNTGDLTSSTTFNTTSLQPLKIPTTEELADVNNKKSSDKVATAKKALEEANANLHSLNLALSAAKQENMVAKSDYETACTTADVTNKKTLRDDAETAAIAAYKAWQNNTDPAQNATLESDYHTKNLDYLQKDYEYIQALAQTQAPTALSNYSTAQLDDAWTHYRDAYNNYTSNPITANKTALDDADKVLTDIQTALSKIEDDSPMGKLTAAKLAVNTAQAKVDDAAKKVTEAQNTLETAQKSVTSTATDNAGGDDTIATLTNYKIQEDGTVVGTSEAGDTIIIGKIALAGVQNTSGLEKSSGYYYSIGANAGNVSAYEGGGTQGKIRGNYLEMAKVDLATEMTDMITTQRGFQANSKIITVTDQMLEELVNMKR